MSLEMIKNWPVIDLEDKFLLHGESWDDSTTLIMHGLIKGVVAERELERTTQFVPALAVPSTADLQRIKNLNVHLYDPINASPAEQDWLESLPWQDWFTLNATGPQMSGQRVVLLWATQATKLEMFKITYSENLGHTPLDIWFYVAPPFRTFVGLIKETINEGGFTV
jgi:hypothetical protein